MNHDSYNCNENSAKSNGRTDLRNHQWSAPKLVNQIAICSRIQFRVRVVKAHLDIISSRKRGKSMNSPRVTSQSTDNLF